MRKPGRLSNKAMVNDMYQMLTLPLNIYNNQSLKQKMDPKNSYSCFHHYLVEIIYFPHMENLIEILTWHA